MPLKGTDASETRFLDGGTISVVSAFPLAQHGSSTALMIGRLIIQAAESSGPETKFRELAAEMFTLEKEQWLFWLERNNYGGLVMLEFSPKPTVAGAMFFQIRGESLNMFYFWTAPNRRRRDIAKHLAYLMCRRVLQTKLGTIRRILISEGGDEHILRVAVYAAAEFSSDGVRNGEHPWILLMPEQQ